MFTPKRNPFTWITIVFIAGLLSAKQLQLPYNIGLLISCSSIFLLLFLSIVTFRSDRLFLVLLIAFIYFAGIFRQWLEEKKFNYYRESLVVGKVQTLQGQVIECKPGDKYWKVLLEVSDPLPSTRIQCYLEKGKIDSVSVEERLHIRCTGKLDSFQSVQNPDAFDYATYMKRKRIPFRMYVKAGDWALSATPNIQLGIYAKLIRFRALLHSILEEQLISKNNLALIKAITLGDKENMDTELLTAFSNTGARHILTVSGMHVGILMLILNYCFSFLPSGTFFSIFRNILIIGVLWLYALLTGAAPAVLRASFMLTIYLIGVMIHKGSSSYNTLAFSAFVLLMISPELITDLSFLFSYTAILSILLFYKPVYRLFKIKYKVLDYFWKLAALSVAAQLLILPVSVYYFHKIPLMFILSSMIATPMAFIIMLVTLLFYLDWFLMHLFYEKIAFILDLLAGGFLKMILLLDDLSFGTLTDVYISPSQLALLLLSAVCLYVLIKLQWKKYLYGLMVTIITFQLYTHYQVAIRAKTSEICFYYDTHVTRIDLFLGRKCYCWTDETEQVINPGYANQNHRLKMNPLSIELLTKGKPKTNEDFFYVTIEDLKIGVLTGNNTIAYECLQLDYLLINTVDLDAIRAFIESVDCKHFILPAKIPYWKTRDIVDILDGAKLFNIRTQGALIIPSN